MFAISAIAEAYDRDLTSILEELKYHLVKGSYVPGKLLPRCVCRFTSNFLSKRICQLMLPNVLLNRYMLSVDQAIYFDLFAGSELAL